MLGVMYMAPLFLLTIILLQSYLCICAINIWLVFAADRVCHVTAVIVQMDSSHITCMFVWFLSITDSATCVF